MHPILADRQRLQLHLIAWALVGGLLGVLVRLLLGANDALRGLTPAETRDNLAAIIDAALETNASVMLAGMEAPTNLGDDYRTAFRATFLELARAYRGRVTYVPFLLEGVAGNPSLNQADGIHPNKDGAQVIADSLFPKLKIMVDGLGGGG